MRTRTCGVGCEDACCEHYREERPLHREVGGQKSRFRPRASDDDDDDDDDDDGQSEDCCLKLGGRCLARLS